MSINRNSSGSIQRHQYANNQIIVTKLQNNKVIKRTYILASIVFFFMVFHSGRFCLRVSKTRAVIAKEQYFGIALFHVVYIALERDQYYNSSYFQLYNVVNPSLRTTEHMAHCDLIDRFPMPVVVYIFISISDWLLVVNSSINFIIYCVIENSFWSEARAVFKGCFSCMKQCTDRS